MHSTYLQLGPLHLPYFGLVAAIGLLAALTLAERCASWAALSPAAVWDAGMTAVIAAFVISRLLLIVFNLHSFLSYPLLILALPSLTSTGVLLTALFMFGYLRWRRLPLLSTLDVAAPAAALLWAFVGLGRMVEGTREGMPTTLPWGIGDRTAGGARLGAGFGAVHPVELYQLLVAAVLCAVLLASLRRRAYAGQTGGLAFFAGGLAVFFLDFFRIPSDILTHAWIDPAQILALPMVVVGAVMALIPPGQRASTQ